MTWSNRPLGRVRPVAGRVLRGLRLLPDPAGEMPRPPAMADDGEAPLAAGLFVNPIAEGADPYVVRDGNHYLWVQTDGDVGVAIWRSDRLTSLGEKHLVWEAPKTGPVSKQV